MFGGGILPKEEMQMKKMIILLAAGALSIACQQPQAASSKEEKSAASSKKITKESLKTFEDKLNYAVGVDIGKNIVRNGLPLSDDIFMKGIRDAVDETTPLLENEEMQKIKKEHARIRRDERKKEREAAAEKNKAEGEKFLKENGAKEGVTTTESGLQYKILKKGTGEKPALTDKVSVNYKGSLIDGTEFDSSYKRGKPAEFAVNRVVKGWTEALQLMPVGSKWQVFIPSNLGYGERGAGAKIGPNAVLIFEVELLEIKKDGKDPNVKIEVPPVPKPKKQNKTDKK
jgi:FKBP-type peptidyl-prolyl cis-trans isomerase